MPWYNTPENFFSTVRGCPWSCARTNPWFRGRILWGMCAQEPPPGSAVKHCRFLGTALSWTLSLLTSALSAKQVGAKTHTPYQHHTDMLLCNELNAIDPVGKQWAAVHFLACVAASMGAVHIDDAHASM